MDLDKEALMLFTNIPGGVWNRECIMEDPYIRC